MSTWCIATRGKREQTSADYCLNCIPMQLLAGIPNNFPADYSGAFTAVPRGKLFKLGLQASERFWEREQIYGGISWTAQDITQIWYPSHGIHRKKGVLLAAYIYGGHVQRPVSPIYPRRSGMELGDQPGREGASRLPALHRKRRQRGVASDEPHARLRGGMERRVVSTLVRAPSGAALAITI